MKTVLLILLFAVSAIAEPSGLDGAFWQGIDRTGRLAWAMGWLDGVSAGQAFITSADYNARVSRWNGATCNELSDGITQFYASDYRNLKVRMTVAAVIVMDYSRGNMTKEQLAAFIAKMRENAITDSH